VTGAWLRGAGNVSACFGAKYHIKRVCCLNVVSHRIRSDHHTSEINVINVYGKNDVINVNGLARLDVAHSVALTGSLSHSSCRQQSAAQWVSASLDTIVSAVLHVLIRSDQDWGTS